MSENTKQAAQTTANRLLRLISEYGDLPTDSRGRVGIFAEIRVAIEKLATPAPQAAPSELRCWSCRKPYTLAQRSWADGNCPHCGVEIELDAAPAVTQAAPSEPVAEVPHVVWEERVACARVADQFAHEEGPGPHRYAGNVISARILARTKSRVATPAPAQQAEGDVSQANARDAARWREAVRNVGFIRCDGGPYWVIGVPCNTYGNSDEQFTAAIDAQIAAIASATASTEGR